MRILFGFMKEEDVLAYPTLISYENLGMVSRPTAITVCKSLKNKGLLKTKKRRVKRHRPTDHYYLDKSIPGFVNIVTQLGLPQSTVLHRDFILQKYVQKQIDINLARAVLADRMRRSLPQVDEIKDQPKYELPILCLIKSSTNALVEFLTDWRPYVDGSQPLRKFSFDKHTGRTIPHYHVGSIEQLIFKLVFLTINDLIRYGKILARDSIVEMASIAGGREKNTDEISPILSMKLKNDETIEFYGGTDTEHWSKTDIPTHADYWFDVKTSTDYKAIRDNLDIDSSKWREKVPKKVGFPSLFSLLDKRNWELVTSRGGVQAYVG